MSWKTIFSTAAAAAAKAVFFPVWDGSPAAGRGARGFASPITSSPRRDERAGGLKTRCHGPAHCFFI